MASEIAARCLAALPPDRGRGKPTAVTPEVAEAIRELREQGLSYRRIAAALTAAGVPAPEGARWNHATVWNVCKSN